MNEKEIIFNNDMEANRVVAKGMRYACAGMALIWLANLLGVFVLDKWMVTITSLVTIVFLLIPSLLVNLLKLSSRWVKYANIACGVFVTGVLYALLGYHAILMYIFPTVLAMLYFNRRLIIATIIETEVCILVSHILSIYFCITPDEPLFAVREVLVYGVFPRSVVYLVITFVSYLCVIRSSNMLKKVFEYSNEVKHNRNCLNEIISQSQNFYSSRNFLQLAKSSIQAVEQLMESYYEKPCKSQGIVCYRSVDEEYYVLKQSGETACCPIENGDIILILGTKSFKISCFFYSTKNNFIQIEDEHLILRFYEERHLVACIILKIDGLRDDPNVHSVLDVLYAQIQLAFINTELHQNLLLDQKELIYSFAEISESKSQQTGQHVKRVSEYMKILARAFYSDESYVDKLGIAAMMHDVGKLLVPDEIIDKPGKLTAEEFEFVKQHTNYGYSLLEHTTGQIMRLAREIALEHHEKWDGTGYMGLKGQTISLNSRIMALVDVFDALVSRRSYKEKWNPDEAYKEIVSQSGKHFDPEIVKAFEEHYSKMLEILEQYPD